MKPSNFIPVPLEIADLIGLEADQHAILSSYEGRAKILTRLGEPQEAIADYQAMLGQARILDEGSAQLRAMNGLASLEASHYSFTKAEIFYDDALAVARMIGDEKGLADTLNQLGNFYANMGQLKKGIEYYDEARENQCSFRR